MTPNDAVRSGVASARSRIAGRSSWTVGSEARVKGRISSRMTGVDSRRNGRVLRSEGASARAAGRRSWSVGPSVSASVFVLASVVCVVRSVPGSLSRIWRRLASWRASVPNTAFEFCTKFASCVSRLPSSSVNSEKLWTTRAMLRRRSARPWLISREYLAVGSRRRIAWASSRPLALDPRPWAPSLSNSSR
jgi:hypothetical protein